MSPRAITPAMWLAFPDMYAPRADDVGQKARVIAVHPGFSVRSIVALNVCAVTGSFEGGEKRKPGRILNV